ncbi:8271fe23-5050-43c3-a469-f8ebee2e9a02 [Sclerotinia trifoliorum]|uniref:8271fe23-5050-43c3-a469-f8ebee2e9a02 n=1 Tax=Sclerotinia trifoliorum TaxID=28548 RepID=A0A8H2W0F4_9HELO|nr:8271fe23-5050-43c3-a469-f8ebee2e9a02 [Sclerotinia trifoliorum]
MVSTSDSLTIIFGCLSLLLTYITAAYFNGRTPSIYIDIEQNPHMDHNAREDMMMEEIHLRRWRSLRE